jgi:hypothetical protein
MHVIKHRTQQAVDNEDSLNTETSGDDGDRNTVTANGGQFISKLYIICVGLLIVNFVLAALYTTIA